MKVKELIEQWNKTPAPPKTKVAGDLTLSVYDRARVRALMDMYPGKTETEILSDLVVAALNEIEEAFPYQAGKKVIREDELGDPVFEDVGPTPRFEQLVKEHVARIENSSLKS